MLAVVSAIPEELGGVRSRLTGARREHAPPLGGLVTGWLGGHPVLLASVGEGDLRARRGAAALVLLHRRGLSRDGRRISGVALLGLAGALTPDLELLEIVSAEVVVSGEGGDRRFEPSPGLLQSAVRAGARPVVSASASGLVSGPAERRSLAERTSPGGSAIVDLESFGLAEVLAGAGVPWVTVRVVSDRAAEVLPGAVLAARDPEGGTQRGRVVLRALRSPGDWPMLLALRRRLLEGARRVVPIVERLAATGEG